MPNWMKDVYLHYQSGSDFKKLILHCHKKFKGASCLYEVDLEDDARSYIDKYKWFEINLQEGINRIGKDW